MRVPGPRVPLALVGAGAAGLAAAGVFGRAAGRWQSRYKTLEFDVHASPGGQQFLRLSEALSGTAVTDGNRVELFVNGDEIFPAMLETIRGAERTLSILSYIYWRGDIAQEVAEAVAERARAGVECRVLLDAFGARLMPSELVELMRDAGARVELFRPLRPGTVRRVNNRTHRRAIIADGRVGMTGGAGIAEEWTGDAQDPDHWRDNHLRLRGPCVRALHGAFAENWLEATGEPLGGEAHLPDLDPLPDGVPVQIVPSTPGTSSSGVEMVHFLGLAAAERSIDLVASYFAPPTAFANALERAAGRGVRVRILTPGAHPESATVREAGRAAYARLMAAGISIFEYDRTVLHAKAMVVDGGWSLMGTANFDHRSLSLNDEVAVGIASEDFAGRLTRCLEKDLGHSREIDPARWRRRFPLRRLRERAALVAAQQL